MSALVVSRYTLATVKATICLLVSLGAVFAGLQISSAQNESGAPPKRMTVSRGNRTIPIAIYAGSPREGARLKPAIISHGYGAKNTDYSFIAHYLVGRGYYVVSIQHEMPGDEPLPKTGNPYETRMPSWQQGVENIRTVLSVLQKEQPDLDYGQLLLVGHSHGGDTSMLFAREHPAVVHTVISLDNRRMPIPRLERPRLFSIRSSDQPADEGVLPSEEEQANLGIEIVKLPATIHNDMWDGGTEEQKAEILALIGRFLQR